MKKYSVLALVALFSVSMVSVSFAEASTSENSVTGFFRKLFVFKHLMGTFRTGSIFQQVDTLFK